LIKTTYAHRLDASIVSTTITRERACCSAWITRRSPTDAPFRIGSKLDGVQRFVERHKRIFAERWRASK
jgi:hypothetical protein